MICIYKVSARENVITCVVERLYFAITRYKNGELG